ncbi:MAG TPA: hypothetical protein VGM44_07685 [Polyangiaceae bacterium]|jgi:ATP-dependent DNA helicase RecQ
MRAKVPARATTILPPPPKRQARRVAPPPLRTPRVPEFADESFDAAPAKPPARAVEARPALGASTWQKLAEAAQRQQRSALDANQRAAIEAALSGRDCLVVIPEDARAVACYELCAPLLARPTVVLSPLLAELHARYEALTLERKPVARVTSELSGPERSAALARIARGGSLLVLLCPESVADASVQKALKKAGIALFVVEEAHCASDFSHEIRPSYAELAATLGTLGRPPIMALTRAATTQVLREVEARLALIDPIIVLAPTVRENLRVVTRLSRGEGRQASLLRLVERLEAPGLVFCAAPHDVDSVYSALRGSGIAAHRYHSGMTPAERAAELLNFTLPGSRGVMVALSAFAPGSGLPGLGETASSAALGFGRGAGRRDLRFVVHYQAPASIEQYLREIARAGLDGAAATCVLFYESSHKSLHEVMLTQQRFRAAHLAELARALEAAALEGRTLTLEALALATGQSRRTTDRLTALLADAGLVSRAGGWVRVITPASDLIEACKRLGAKLYALREQDGQRLAAVASFAETENCKVGFLSRYLESSSVDWRARCDRCSACSAELSATESIVPLAPARRAVVQEFNVRPVTVPLDPAEKAPLADTPLTAKIADFRRN